LLRPHQWLKNGFVFVGLLFGHAWNDPVKLGQALAAFAAFCLLASAVYVMNDLIDREQDRLHPQKKGRPLAAGSVSVAAAMTLAAFCLLAGGAIAWLWAGSAPWFFLAYVALNVAYSLASSMSSSSTCSSSPRASCCASSPARWASASPRRNGCCCAA